MSVDLSTYVDPVAESDPFRYSATGNLIQDAAWKMYMLNGTRWTPAGGWTIVPVGIDTVEKRGPFRAELVTTGLAVTPTLDGDYIAVGSAQVYALALEHALTGRTLGRFLVQLLEYDQDLVLIQTSTLLDFGGVEVLEEFESTTGWTLPSAATLTAETTIKQSGTASLKLAIAGLVAGATSVSSKVFTEIDLSSRLDSDKLRFQVRVSSLTNLAYTFLRLGNDVGNYREYRYLPAAIDTWYTGGGVAGNWRAPDVTVGTVDETVIDYIAVGAVATGGALTSNIYFDVARIDPDVAGDTDLPWPAVSIGRFMGSLATPPSDDEMHLVLHADTRFVRPRYAADTLSSGNWKLVSQTLNEGVLSSLDANALSSHTGYVYSDAGILYIENGRIVFDDEFGINAITGGGFGPSWLRFLTNGVYNGDFVAPPPDEASDITGIDGDNPLPYWDFVQASGSAVSVQSDADISTASGRSLRFAMAAGAAGDDGYITQLLPVNGSRTQSFYYRVTAAWQRQLTSSNALEVYVACRFIRHDGTTEVGSSFEISKTIAQLNALDPTDMSVALGKVPADAYFLRLKLGFRRGAAATSQTDELSLYEVRLDETSLTSGIAARVYKTIDTAIVNANETVLTFNAERRDEDGMHSLVTNTNRLTAFLEGWHRVTGNVRWAASAVGFRSLSLRLNGTTVIGAVQDSAAATGIHVQQVTCDWYFRANDYAELLVNQTSGGNLDIVAAGNYSPEFSMSRIGD